MFAKDKIYHFVAGAVIAFLVAWFAKSPGAGFMAGILAGAAKELYDMAQNKRAQRKHLVEPHSVEFEDVLATAIGGAAGALIATAAMEFL